MRDPQGCVLTKPPTDMSMRKVQHNLVDLSTYPQACHCMVELAEHLAIVCSIIKNNQNYVWILARYDEEMCSIFFLNDKNRLKLNNITTICFKSMKLDI